MPPTIVGFATFLLLILCVVGWKFPACLNLLNFIILGLTLIVLVWYTYDTHRMANQTVEANLKPVVLQSGYIQGWNSIQFTLSGGTITGQPLEFQVLKNIAADISGYIVINNRQYTLLFGNQISQIPANNSVSIGSSTQPLINYVPSWGWMAPGNAVFGVFDPTQYQRTTDQNGIYVRYKDTEGNKYFTREDQNFSSISGKL